MAKQHIPMTCGDEVDALGDEKRHLYWKPGERKRIKRSYHRRARRVDVMDGW